MQNVFRRLGWGLLSFNRRIFFIALMGFGGVARFAHSSTPVGTLISSFASVDYEVSGVPASTTSNTVSFNVDEILLFTFVSNNPLPLSVQSPQTNAVLSFTLTNQGNGTESYSLSLTQSLTDNFNPTSSQIFIDSNDNGVFDNGVDVLHVAGINDPALAMNESVEVFAVSNIQSGLTLDDEAELSLEATTQTLEGDTTGDGGLAAVLGFQGQSLVESARYKFSSATATLTKSQAVLDPYGGSAVIQNSVLTFTLTLAVTGAGDLTSVVVEDPIPAGSTYEAGTLTLNGSPLTDAADIDAGVFNGSEIQVSLGTVSAPTTHTVTFKVRVN